MIHHILFRSWGGGDDERNLLTLCARCHGLVHEGYLKVTKGATGTLRFTDRDGRGLRAPLVAREVGIGRGAPAAAGNARASTAIVPQYLEPHQVPSIVDGAWWLQHQHCFEWTRDGRGVRLRKPPRGA